MWTDSQDSDSAHTISSVDSSLAEEDDFEQFQREALIALDVFAIVNKDFQTLKLDSIYEDSEDEWDNGGAEWPCRCCEPLGITCLCADPGMSNKVEEVPVKEICWFKKMRSRLSLIISKRRQYVAR